jgi:hypothetical protein
MHCNINIYEGRLQSSWTHLITPSRNLVEVRWRSLFRSTSLDKRCTSYNVPLTSRKRAADRWSLRNFLSRSFLFMVGKAQKSHGAKSEFNSVFGLEKVDRHPPYSSDPTSCDFRAFPTMKRELRGKKFRSDQRSAAHFREVGGALQEVHRFQREVLRKRDLHHTSTKFRLGVIRWVHELFKQPSYTKYWKTCQQL